MNNLLNIRELIISDKNPLKSRKKNAGKYPPIFLDRKSEKVVIFLSFQFRVSRQKPLDTLIRTESNHSRIHGMTCPYNSGFFQLDLNLNHPYFIHDRPQTGNHPRIGGIPHDCIQTADLRISRFPESAGSIRIR
jgi:hypothetical protein